ncbi:MAG: ATP-binding protein [Microscillaceae bacterium]|nr:ATP-binding protein [Microscillaceae bacterium]
MKIKNKLKLITAFFLAISLIIGVLGIYYLNRLANDAQMILKDNHLTLVYMQNINIALNEIQFHLPTQQKEVESQRKIQSGLKTIQKNLNGQLKNITETGEQLISELVKEDFDHLKTYFLLISRADSSSKPIYRGKIAEKIFSMQQHTHQIYTLNTDALIRKNKVVDQTANQVIVYMTLIVISSTLISLGLFSAIPSWITRPIAQLNEAIEEIKRKNYQHKIQKITQDEFGTLALAFNQMTGKLYEYEHSNYAQILSEKRRIDAVINQMQDAIIGLDENKNILFANRKALTLLDISKENLIGKYAPNVAVQNSLLSNLIQELMIGFESWEEEKYAPVKIVVDGREKLFAKNIVDIIVRPTGEEIQQLAGHVIILSDITTFVEKDLAKTQFMAILSHELKTPVAAINMSTNLLLNEKIGKINAEQKDLVQTIEKNTQRIQQTIYEILDMAKIESGSMDIQLSTIHPRMLIQKAIEGVLPLVNDKKLRLITQLETDSKQVIVDFQKSIWVLNNFLVNAIRHSPEQGAIHIRTQDTSEGIKILVKDEGEGIAPTDQKKIFEKFTRLHPNDSQGTGLGLAISKEFVEAMEGKIGVESDLGKGSTFWIELPWSR